MEATLLPSSPKSTFLLNNSNKNKINLFRNRFFFHPTGRPFRLRAIDGDNGSNDATQSPSTPEAVEIRFRRGSRKRAKQQVQDMGDGSSASGRGVPSPPKDWDSMTLGEKAVELYMGEKGLLFWINKFAYASIFIIIGGWILFRFVGPSLGLYQLDSAPLPPSAVFKQS